MTYSLDHLDPFTFPIDSDSGLKNTVRVQFRCHCFTEEIKPHHTPDFHYTHDGERRAFSIERYCLSKLLPELVRNLDKRSVYRSTLANMNYFVVRQDPSPIFTGPYLVFFNVARAKKANCDVAMYVESAYMKPNMIDRGSPVRFSTLIRMTARGKPIPFGPIQTVKRK